MPRKPFEALDGDRELDCGWLVALEKANAAIAQDKEYALRRIREENHEGMIYYRERDEARAERDALREENEKLREQCDRYDHIIPSMAKGRNDFRSALKKTRAQLAEAVKEIERLKSELATR